MKFAFYDHLGLLALEGCPVILAMEAHMGNKTTLWELLLHPSLGVVVVFQTNLHLDD